MAELNIEVSELDLVWGLSDLKRYLSREQVGSEYWNEKALGARWASRWFFKGLKRDEMAEWGVKAEAPDLAKGIRFLQSMLASYAPSHEQKIATVGYYLDSWFELSEIPE